MAPAVTFNGNKLYVQQASAGNEGDQTLTLLAKSVACKTILVFTLTHILDHIACGGSRKTSEFPVYQKQPITITQIEHLHQLVKHTSHAYFHVVN